MIVSCEGHALPPFPHLTRYLYGQSSGLKVVVCDPIESIEDRYRGVEIGN